MLSPVASGLSQPLHVTSAGDGTDRLFVVEKAGRIKVIQNGAVTGTFLDITGRVLSAGSEQGLLSVAFPPGYATRGYFYVNYTAPGIGAAGHTRVSRFHLSSAAAADPSSEEILLTVAQPYVNHNGGLVMFGPDGQLYVGMGDGGSGGDPQNHAQTPGDLLGKMLRLDVESTSGPYTPEVWAMGLRNPWRFSWDRGNGDMYIADVGQGQYEEVNFHAAADPGGQNYGWRLKEGLHCFNPSTNCDPGGLTDPVVEYSHSVGGCSVTGGFVYRAMTYWRMWGTYFYGDYCSGIIWGLTLDNGTWRSQPLVDTPYNISSFGEDDDGRVYLTDFAGGAVYELTDPSGPRVGAFKVRLPVLPDAGRI